MNMLFYFLTDVQLLFSFYFIPHMAINEAINAITILFYVYTGFAIPNISIITIINVFQKNNVSFMVEYLNESSHLVADFALYIVDVPYWK